MAIGTSSGGYSWEIYSAPLFFIDGNPAICMDRDKDFPINQPYNLQIVGAGVNIPNTSGSQQTNSNRIMGIIKKANELTNNLSSMTGEQNVKIWATINAVQGNLNLSTLQSFGDSFVSALLSAPDYAGELKLYHPGNSAYQRLADLGNPEPPKGWVIFKKCWRSCGTASGNVDYRDWAVDVYSNARARVGRYYFNSNFQTNAIELRAGEYTWQEVRVNNYGTGKLHTFDASGSFTIISNQTTTFCASDGILEIDCTKLSIDITPVPDNLTTIPDNITQAYELKDYIDDLLFNLRCRVKLIEPCDIIKWFFCEGLPTIHKAITAIVCWLIEHVKEIKELIKNINKLITQLKQMIKNINTSLNSINNGMQSYKDAICCLQEQIGILMDRNVTRTMNLEGTGYFAGTQLYETESADGVFYDLSLEYFPEEDITLKKGEKLFVNIDGLKQMKNERIIETETAPQLIEHEESGKLTLGISNKNTFYIVNKTDSPLEFKEGVQVNANFSWHEADDIEKKGGD